MTPISLTQAKWYLEHANDLTGPELNFMRGWVAHLFQTAAGSEDRRTDQVCWLFIRVFPAVHEEKHAAAQIEGHEGAQAGTRPFYYY